MISHEVVFSGDALTLRVSDQTVAFWKSFCQINENDQESFGVIIGSRTDGRDEYWIDLVTEPYSSDQATRNSFFLQDNEHQDTVDLAFEQSGGTSIYLGTWHTHPEAIPIPSSTDRKDWLGCIKRNPDKQLFFVIVGLMKVRIFVRESVGDGFRRLILEE